MSAEEQGKVKRIPIKEYIRSQFRAILVFLFLLVILFFIVQLSGDIAPDRNEINPPNVIRADTNSSIILMALSTLLFLSIFTIFTKVVLLDHKKDFGITQWNSARGIVTFILTTSFISLVHLLLDVALINVYLITFPVWLMWKLPQLIPSDILSFIPQGVDKVAYADIRSIYFLAIIALLFVFPVTMLISIFTRFGRKYIKNRRERKAKLPVRRLLLYFILFPIIGIILANIYFNLNLGEILGPIFIFLMGILALSWFVVILLLLSVLIRITAVFTYSNFLLIFPIIFFFYLLPGILWAIWDVGLIASRDPTSLSITDNTIYRALDISLTSAQKNVTSMSVTEFLGFFFHTMLLNLGSVPRVIQLDFVLVVGVAALIIGFAEGYSLFAIVRSITSGVSFARTGQIATRSAPRIFVLTSQLFYLFAWLGLLWDNLLLLAANISDYIGIDLSFIHFPHIFSFITDFVDYFEGFGNIQALIALLVVPLYFIITSSFKFLGVSLVLSRYDEDSQTYTLLISSAFILIVTHILGDIAALDAFIGAQNQFLPTAKLQDSAGRNLLPFAIKLFNIFESMAFYVGFAVTIFFGLKRLFRSKEEKEAEKALKAEKAAKKAAEEEDVVEHMHDRIAEYDTPAEVSYETPSTEGEDMSDFKSEEEPISFPETVTEEPDTSSSDYGYDEDPSDAASDDSQEPQESDDSDSPKDYY